MDEKNARAAVGLITSRWTGSLRVPMRHCAVSIFGRIFPTPLLHAFHAGKLDLCALPS